MGTILDKFDNLTITDHESLEKNKKQLEYVDYIVEHISNVQKAYQIFFIPLLDKEIVSDILSEYEFKSAILNCKNSIEEHDSSKFEEEEFEAYRLKFYPTTYEHSLDDNYQRWVEESFDDAWKHHYMNNKHHPLHWVDPNTNVASDMDLESIIEMICDWEAMSMKFNSDTIDWYNKADNEKSQMSDNTKRIVEEILFNIVHC